MAMSLQNIRSLLFAPGSDRRKLERALRSGSDAVVADLEDAVAPDRKATARRHVAEVLAATDTSAARLVRVNGVGSDFFSEDLAGIERLALDAIVLPKATPDAAYELGAEGPPIVAIVETAHGLRLSFETASVPRVAALLLGAVDLAAELRLEERPDAQEILFARSKVVLESAAAGIRPPFDRVYLDVRDDDGLAADAATARTLGFRGKACIHPNQVAIVNSVFGTERDVAWAERTLAAYEQALREGKGAVTLDGRMIDRAVALHARRLLEDRSARG